jgi:hypothetical protein
MFIAVNANNHLLRSEKRKAGCDFASSQPTLLRTEKEGILLLHNYKHLALNGGEEVV